MTYGLLFGQVIIMKIQRIQNKVLMSLLYKYAIPRHIANIRAGAERHIGHHNRLLYQLLKILVFRLDDHDIYFKQIFLVLLLYFQTPLVLAQSGLLPKKNYKHSYMCKDFFKRTSN